jgi:hypothetical protein
VKVDSKTLSFNLRGKSLFDFFENIKNAWVE